MCLLFDQWIWLHIFPSFMEGVALAYMCNKNSNISIFKNGKYFYFCGMSMMIACYRGDLFNFRIFKKLLNSLHNFSVTNLFKKF